MGAPCQSNVDCIGSDCETSNITPTTDSNCPGNNYTLSYYDKVGVYECRMATNQPCNNGAFTTKIKTTLHNGCQVEVQLCDPCHTCNNQKGWQDLGNGYMQRVKSCSHNNFLPTVCNSEIEYQCAPGYYGTTYNGTSGCTKCPNSCTSPAGSTAASQCYIDASTQICDDTGCSVCTSNWECVK